MIDGNTTNKSFFSLRMPKKIRLVDAVLGICLAFSVQGLVFVFLFYVPSISDQVVNSVDRSILASVQSTARNAAIMSAIAGSAVTICLVLLIRAVKSRKNVRDKPGGQTV